MLPSKRVVIIQSARNTVEDVNAIYLTSELFCECCGMRLRASPANREYKEKVRAIKKNQLVEDVVRRRKKDPFLFLLFLLLKYD
jgi:hypothetical protein